MIYSNCILLEMKKRGFRVKSLENFFEYFADVHELKLSFPYRFVEHDDEYLLCNYYNLLEKYRRGQKDFSEEEVERLNKFVKKSVGGKQ